MYSRGSSYSDAIHSYAFQKKINKTQKQISPFSPPFSNAV